MSGSVHHPGETTSVLTHRMGLQDANIVGNVHVGDVLTLRANREAGLRREVRLAKPGELRRVTA